jgi:hypothetical protein
MMTRMTSRMAPPRDSSVMSDPGLELEDGVALCAEVEESSRIVHVRGDVAFDDAALGDEDAEDAEAFSCGGHEDTPGGW